jgi:ABC-type molybdate transport system permease subunit
MVKMGLGALLAWVAQNAMSFELPAWVLAVIVVVVPLAINILNPADGRYGVGKFNADAVDDADV